MEELEGKRRQVLSLRGQERVDPQDRAEALEEFNFFRSAWRARKDKAMALVDMLADGMEKSVREVAVRFTIFYSSNTCFVLIDWCRPWWGLRQMKMWVFSARQS